MIVRKILCRKHIFYLSLQNRDIIFHCYPQILWVYCIIAMYKHMAHTFHCPPLHFWMFVSKLFCQHIGCFAYNFDKLYKAIENQRIVFQIIQNILVLIRNKLIATLKNMLQASFISNFLSHRSIVYRVPHFFLQKASIPHPLQDQHFYLTNRSNSPLCEKLS